MAHGQRHEECVPPVRRTAGSHQQRHQTYVSEDARAQLIDVRAPLAGTLVSIARPGDHVQSGEQLAIIESMKMEHVVESPQDGIVEDALVKPGQTLHAGQALLVIRQAEVMQPDRIDDDDDDERTDLAEVIERHRLGLDELRPEAVAKRKNAGHRTARENIADLIDEDSLIEFGSLAIAAQRRRREVDDLIANTPADGLVGGIATINGCECVVASYDYMVLAGTQGQTNHRKKDRLFQLAERRKLPIVFFTEGGGGRPGDTDAVGVSWLDCLAFALFGRLAGTVPLIGVNSGYCFAGNAALLGTCDVVIATRDSNIGMGGPAMIEGGGLGTFSPTDIGPAEVHSANGVIDVLVDDEESAVAAAQKIIGFTQDRSQTWDPPTDPDLRNVVPQNRKRVYDMRDVIAGLVDVGSAIELRADWNPGMVTLLTRVDGHALGIVANNPLHLSGAIDDGGARKSAEFMALCDSWGLPLLFLCDTPGFMVGPESDAQGLPRTAGSLFRVGANLSVPFGTVITRKGYGLGAQAMAGGGFKEPLFTIAWPTGEFGPMGLEGAVELGFSKELAATESPADRADLFDQLVGRLYEHGKATNVASHFEIDDVIDPADTRRWVSRLLFSS